MMQKFTINENGRDFVVGDIHGMFDKLTERLHAIKFDPTSDRLFAVGDLVDHGPMSSMALPFIAQPWFHSVRGNHEQMAIEAFESGDPAHHIVNGGAWFALTPRVDQEKFVEAFASLPILIQVETKSGSVGIVHAEYPMGTWTDRRGHSYTPQFTKIFRDNCIWSRDRYTDHDESIVAGIDRIYVGHTPIRDTGIKVLGNHHYIDTGAVFGGPLTIIEL